MIFKNKKYILINKLTKEFCITDFCYSHTEGEEEPMPTYDNNMHVCELTNELIGDLDEKEFIENYKPVLSEDGASILSWSQRSNGPSVSISESPYDDGSNITVVTLEGGPSGESFLASFSRPVSMNISKGEGQFNENGGAEFKFKVIGQEPLTLKILPRNNNEFIESSLEIDVIPAPFE